MEQEQTKHHGWVVILLILVIGIGGVAAYMFLRSAPAVETVVPTELISPAIATLAEAEQYLGDKPMPPSVDAGILPPIKDDEHLWGEKNAPVTIVMYGNLTGTYSRLLIPAIRSLVDDSNGGVNLIFRNYPLTENPLDYDAAELGECTYVQKSDAGYWSYVDALLAGNARSTDELLASVTAVGADAVKAKKCLDGEDTWDYVVAQKQDAQLSAKLFVAPSFIITNRTTGDTRIVEGLNTKAYIQAVVDDLR